MTSGLKSRLSELMEPEIARGRAVPGIGALEHDPSSMVQEELARLAFALEKLDFAGKSVLDFGCGTGYAAHYLEKASPAEITGVDSSAASIAFAKRNFPQHSFVCSDAMSMDLGIQFDIVMTFEVIEHVHDPARFLEVAAAHLRTSGTLILSTPNRLLFSLGREHSILNKTHVHEFVEAELRSLLGRYFENVTMYGQRHQTDPMQHAFFADVLREETKQLTERALCGRLGLDPPSLEKRALLRYPVRAVLNIPRWYHKAFDPSERNLHKRTRHDFRFSDRLDDAIWFVCICCGKR